MILNFRGTEKGTKPEYSMVLILLLTWLNYFKIHLYTLILFAYSSFFHTLHLTFQILWSPFI